MPGETNTNTVPDDTGTILVTISQTEEIEADHADLFVTIRGASLFTGRAALTKAREVTQLVASLQAIGIADSEVRLQGVRADVSSGVLGKTSSATYSLKICCSRLEMLAETLGAITSQKNTSLQSLVWGYEDNDEQRLLWLEACIAHANAKASRIAEGLGVTLLGIASFTESFADPEAGIARKAEMPDFSMARARREPSFTEELGMEVSHTKTVTLTINVTYRVSPFAPQQAV